MTLPQNVKDALESADANSGLALVYMERDDYNTIRAHLLSQDAELKILRVKCSGTLANNLCPDHRDKQVGNPCLACTIEKLQSRLAAANERLEAAERDAFKWQLLCADCDDAGEGNRAAINIVNDACRLGSGALERHYGQAARDGLDAAIAATQESEETWEIWERGMCVAGADDLGDAQHYLTMYGQDGPVKLVRVISYRETVTPDAIDATQEVE